MHAFTASFLSAFVPCRCTFSASEPSLCALCVPRRRPAQSNFRNQIYFFVSGHAEKFCSSRLQSTNRFSPHPCALARVSDGFPVDFKNSFIASVNYVAPCLADSSSTFVVSLLSGTHNRFSDKNFFFARERLSPVHPSDASYARKFAVFALILSSLLSQLFIAHSGIASSEVVPKVKYTLALHGGAGDIEKTMPTQERLEYEAALSEALDIGIEILTQSGSSIDAVQAVVCYLEDNPLFNAGRGSVFAHNGTIELEASMMDGRNSAIGAVTGVKTVKNPVTLARHVMEKKTSLETTFLAGDGAERFADECGVQRVPPEYFHTQKRYESLVKELNKGPNPELQPEKSSKLYGTVGCVALDTFGNLAAATSTGGQTNKMNGRIGDSPVIGAGTFAWNKTCAVSGTGNGEEFQRFCVAHDISAAMEYGGKDLQSACEHVINTKLQPDVGGVVAVDSAGNIGIVFNTMGMFHAAASSQGYRIVGMWK